MRSWTAIGATIAAVVLGSVIARSALQTPEWCRERNDDLSAGTRLNPYEILSALRAGVS